MASIFITGSSDGIGLETARQLVRAGHQVTLHARNAARAGVLADQVAEAHGIAVGDFSVLCGIRRPFVALWSPSSGKVRQVEVSDALLRPSGYLKASLILAPAPGAGFTFLALEGEGGGPILRTVQVQPIG